MDVESLIHFKFVYYFVGNESKILEKDVYAADAEAAREQFESLLINAQRYIILSVKIIESC